ncbi:tyrosine--tRNA ligase [Actinopolymorpha singaporensis]|uniref:Tyrosine--tRNA ligase n=1 Tax=Actinopolymorpha singaporensis TaxID=117157 RepID=A0A1H1N3P1_9ACTN|nr:tyrosine--tRNA ligase [Actinopolymorpha singaporensis]SDR93510.1 tyrosyl-tRNA synthetase [Actinopolymorpha singaporensis]
MSATMGGSAADRSGLLADLARTTDEVVSRPELQALLDSGRPLRIKYGVDCTAPFLHLGHAVNLWMMRRLQDAGHTVVFLLGDVTTQVGDPTGRTETRPVLPCAEIEANAGAFLEQAGMVLRTEPEVFEVRRNSEWYDTLTTRDWLTLLSHVTHGQLMARDMFRRRVAEGREIAMHELVYPVLQGYDSWAMRSDLTIVGSDQLFNEMLGRHYQQRLGGKPQVVITTRITPGIDGRAKQSKSLGNYVALTDPPREKFGKLMSIPDALVPSYLEVYTTVPMARVDQARQAVERGGREVRDAKLGLAEAVVARYHGAERAAAEREWFSSTFSARHEPTDVPVLPVAPGRADGADSAGGGGLTVWDLVCLAQPDLSRSAARRLVDQGGVRLDERVLADVDEVLPAGTGEGALLRIGRRRWFRLTWNAESA